MTSVNCCCKSYIVSGWMFSFEVELV